MVNAFDLSRKKRVEHLYRDNYAWLFAWLFKNLKQQQDAEDVVQSTFVKVLSAELANIKYSKSFLAKIASRIVIDQIRHKRIEQAYLEHLTALNMKHDATPETIMLAVELFERIVLMLQDLDGLSQKIFLMSYIDHMSQVQIADQLQLSRRQVQYALIKALQHCDQIIRPD